MFRPMLIFVVGIVCVLASVMGCGSGNASSGVTVQKVFALDGATCYVILNSSSEAVGGNCIPMFTSYNRE